mgnify:FL=1
MNIDRNAPTAQELSDMYQRAGWIENPDPDQMTRSVVAPSEWFVARDDDNCLMGIGRVITDYVRYAFIVDVITKSEYQKRGIASQIMDDITLFCRELGLESVNLWPSEGKVGFYEKLGFYPLPPSQPHMKLK